MAEAMQFQTAVIFVIFRRPDVTRLVFDAIAKARPKKLFVLCDAPRPHKVGEAALVDETRAIVEHVDWPCEVYRRYATENMGCEQSISTGLDWVFTHVDRAIVLEDDCLPDPSFFSFCESMLDRYENDAKVMAISGDQFLSSTDFCEYSVYFSKHFFCWGWATWKTAWAKYDRQMKGHEAFLRDELSTVAVSENEFVYIRNAIESTLSGRLDSWAIRFSYAVMVNAGVCLQPCVNLVSNLGNGAEGTHWSSEQDSSVFYLPTEAVHLTSFPETTDRNLEAELAWAEEFAKPRQRGPIFSVQAWRKRFRQYRKSIAKRIGSRRCAA